jgi:predicted Fe-S protein YdhL (DUF1289 family)
MLPGDESSRYAMSAIESPCTRICTVDPAAGLCRGCGRSLAEIEHWVAFTSAQRAEIMADLPGRLADLRRRAAGARYT